jgi:hypothetical protein
MHARPPLLGLGTVLMLAACATKSGTPVPSAAPARNADVVTMGELNNAPTYPNLHEALQALRPGWFRRFPTRLSGPEGDIVVYLDRQRLGGPETLRDIQLSGVTGVRYYGPSEAQAAFGLDHTHGAIQVTSSP